MFRRADLRDLNDFPNLSGLDSFVEEDQEGVTSQPFSAQTGSLLFDSSFVFSPGQPELNFTRNTNSAANFFESSVTGKEMSVLYLQFKLYLNYILTVLYCIQIQLNIRKIKLKNYNKMRT